MPTGLAALGRKAGYAVTALRRGGGDASKADVVAVAVPGPATSAALGAVTGLADKIAIDGTYAYPSGNEANPSLAKKVKSFTSGPAAKSSNLNFAVRYDQIAAQRVRPRSSDATDDGARQVTQQLIIDVGCDPVPLGGLDTPRTLEDLTWLLLLAAMKTAPSSSAASPSTPNGEPKERQDK